MTNNADWDRAAWAPHRLGSHHTHRLRLDSFLGKDGNILADTVAAKGSAELMRLEMPTRKTPMCGQVPGHSYHGCAPPRDIAEDQATIAYRTLRLWQFWLQDSRTHSVNRLSPGITDRSL